jgi:hypothetical protein
MKLASARVEGFLRRPDPEIRAVLLYGPDAGLVRERAERKCFIGFFGIELGVDHSEIRRLLERFCPRVKICEALQRRAPLKINQQTDRVGAPPSPTATTFLPTEVEFFRRIIERMFPEPLLPGERCKRQVTCIVVKFLFTIVEQPALVGRNAEPLVNSLFESGNFLRLVVCEAHELN